MSPHQMKLYKVLCIQYKESPTRLWFCKGLHSRLLPSTAEFMTPIKPPSNAPYPLDLSYMGQRSKSTPLKWKISLKTGVIISSLMCFRKCSIKVRQSSGWRCRNQSLRCDIDLNYTYAPSWLFGQCNSGYIATETSIDYSHFLSGLTVKEDQSSLKYDITIRR